VRAAAAEVVPRPTAKVRGTKGIRFVDLVARRKADVVEHCTFGLPAKAPEGPGWVPVDHVAVEGERETQWSLPLAPYELWLEATEIVGSPHVVRVELWWESGEMKATSLTNVRQGEMRYVGTMAWNGVFAQDEDLVGGAGSVKDESAKVFAD
jgi:hypothetical protein